MVTSGLLTRKDLSIEIQKSMCWARVFADEHTALWGSWVAERWAERVQVMKRTSVWLDNRIIQGGYGNAF